MVCTIWMIRSSIASTIVGAPTMSYQLEDGYCEIMMMDFRHVCLQWFRAVRDVPLHQEE